MAEHGKCGRASIRDGIPLVNLELGKEKIDRKDIILLISPEREA